VNDIPVLKSRIILHLRNDSLISITGNFYSNFPNIQFVNNINPSFAINNVISNVQNNVIKFIWTDTTQENVSLNSYYPNPNLSILPKTDTVYDSINNYDIVYPIKIKAVWINDPDSSYIDSTYYFSVISNSIIKRERRFFNCFHSRISHISLDSFHLDNKFQPINKKYKTPLLSSSCSTCIPTNVDIHYYGTNKTIYTNERTTIFGCGGYIPKDVCTNTFLYIKKWNDHDFVSSDNSWVGGTPISKKVVATALWSLRQCHDFYRIKLNRNSYNNNYAQIKIKLTKYSYAYYPQWDINDNLIWIDKLEGTSSYPVTLDVIGHELTHGVTQYIVNFPDYDPSSSDESGALAEGISDIFGQAIEHYVKSLYPSLLIDDYLAGSQLPVSVGCDSWFRDIKNPKNTCNPDTKNGINYIYNGNSAHKNSTVISHFYYLLAEGGQGVNDLGNSYCVNGIGQDKAIKIIYESLFYIGNQKNFSGFRNAVLIAASNLYGFGPEFWETIAALYAVGIETNSPSNFPSNYPFVIISKTDNSTTSYHYNNSIEMINYTALPGAYVDVSSNQEIHLKSYFYQNPSPPNINYEVHFSQGSEVHLYIAPACAGGAKLANSANSKNNNILEDTSPYAGFSINPSNNKTVSTLFPNPTSSLIHLQLSTRIENTYTFKISNLFGQSLSLPIQKLSDTMISIDFSNVAEGVYIVYYSDNEGNVFTNKVVVKR
jgi:hypothetical protein